VVSAGQDGTLRFWDGLQLSGTIECGSGPLRACAISADGKLLVAGGSDGRLSIWRRPSAGELANRARIERIMRQVPDSRPLLLSFLEGHEGAVFACALSADGSLLVSGGDDGTVRIWDVPARRPRAILEGHAGRIWCCAASRHGDLIASGGEDATVRIWDAAQATERARFVGSGASVRGCAISPDTAFVASASTDGFVRIWSLATAEVVARIPLPGEALCVAWHPRDQLIVSGDRGGGLHLLDLVDLEG
jgi:WD40 repeat protein